MNIVDSCGWLEYFADGANARFFAPAIEDIKKLIIPAICVLDVFKKVYQERGEDMALQAATLMQQGPIIVLDTALSLSAAKISADLKLPLADSIIIATGRIHHAVIWTQDADFEGLSGVKYVRKR